MNFQEKIAQLRAEIDRALTPLITNDYVLLDVPYHGNIGDTLIWQGEMDFLSTLPHKCLGVHSADSWWGNSLHPEAIILLHGGGNFGDLYRGANTFRNEIISRYPNNRIVMFPQSIWYEDMSLVEKDAKIMASHNNLYLCARDNYSYDFMKKYFSANNILLVPDAAFFISDSLLSHYRGCEENRNVYIRRLDKEITSTTPIEISEKYEIHDWPTIEHLPLKLRILLKLSQYTVTAKLVDFLSIPQIRDYLVNIGLNFIKPYNEIVTTRLHVMILSILLHKPVRYIDNSSGKISAFVNTWLSDLNSLKPYQI